MSLTIGGVALSVKKPFDNGVVRNGVIKGIVTELGLPVVRKVMCYNRFSSQLQDITYSDADGEYRFDNLIAGVRYFITSVDNNNDAVQYNAVTQDLITASEVVL